MTSNVAFKGRYLYKQNSDKKDGLIISLNSKEEAIKRVKKIQPTFEFSHIVQKSTATMIGTYSFRKKIEEKFIKELKFIEIRPNDILYKWNGYVNDPDGYGAGGNRLEFVDVVTINKTRAKELIKYYAKKEYPNEVYEGKLERTEKVEVGKAEKIPEGIY